MSELFKWITLSSMLLMSLLILVQTRGASLGAGLGGGGEVNTERRGTDKSVYQLTIVVAAVFVMSIILGIIIS